MSICSISSLVLFVLLALPAAPAQQGAPAPPPDGAVIFARRCSQCHGAHGEGVSGVVTIAGPNLQAEHDKGRVLTAIETGPSHMPVFSYVLTVPQMDAVADFVVNKLAIIPLEKGELAEGGKLFRDYCASCHRTAVRGGAMTYTGVNAPDLSEKSPALIAGAIRWGPGPMPPFPPEVLSDHQLDSIVNYVTFVQYPPSPGGSPMNFFGPVAEGFAAWIGVFLLIFVAGWIEKGGKG